MNDQKEIDAKSYGLPIAFRAIKYASYKQSPYHVGELEFAIDFVCEIGTPVSASRDGTIIDIDLSHMKGDKENEGNFIEIRHNDDEYSEYEHLKCQIDPYFRIGMKVKRGNIIGLSGDTGALADLGPHLHFMVGKYSYQTIPIRWHELSNPIRVLREIEKQD